VSLFGLQVAFAWPKSKLFFLVSVMQSLMCGPPPSRLTV